MKIKVYLNDWFFNAGIVGFLKILQENNDNFAVKKANYIEFDTEDLRNFSKYYFSYFFNKYNVAASLKARTKYSFEYIENNLELIFEDKNAEKQRKDKIKSSKDYVKKAIKVQMDKIKKFNTTVYDNLKSQYDKIDKEVTNQGIIEVKKRIFSLIESEDINQRLTLNLFKSILSNAYFGQPSFLNVTKSTLSYVNQQDLMYKDYISTIVELGFIQDILDNKYDIQKIQEYIKNSKDNVNISSSITNVYLKIEKDYINKNKNVESIQEYLRNKVVQRCSLCECTNRLTSNYSEGNFVPLAISSDNARNFFWNQNVSMPICDVCKLILFCIPAGITSIPKTEKDKDGYKETQTLGVVNYDTSVDRLYKTNVSFGSKSKYDNDFKNPYAELILDIVEQDRQISTWQLQNIFFVEFDANYGSYSRINYFNIKRYVATFFIKYSAQTLSYISDYKYQLQLVDSILKNKDIKYIVNERLRAEISKEVPNGYNSYIATRIRMILELLKKGDYFMEDIKKNDDKLYVVYNIGMQIHEELKRKHEENKISGYSYKLLNSIKAGDKKEFIDTVIRIHMSMDKDVSGIFVEAIQSKGLDFESIGHSFLAGLISNKYEKNEEVKNNG